MTVFRVLPGLPPYGPPATDFGSFSHTGEEGYVVEFLPDTPRAWAGNFAPGLGGYSGVHVLLSGWRVAVFSRGSGYVVDADTRRLRHELPGEISRVWEVANPAGLVCDRQGLAFFRITSDALVWHTRRLSWDGFRDLVLTPERITGMAFGREDVWLSFVVDLATGRSQGGAALGGVDQEWERLAAV